MMMQTMRAEPAISIRDLVKVFGDFWRRPRVRAVDGLTLDIMPGEVFGLLGPNGSGKSTTLKILLGLLHPTGGVVRVLGRPPQDVAVKKMIGYVPEENYLYAGLTPRETLDFFGQICGLARDVRRERVHALLDMAGLMDAADRPVGEFSKGMARRVALAQALVNHPRLVILDEPTAGLDPIGCRQMKDIIRALAAAGCTVVLSSHLLADVADVCGRVAILFNGKAHAVGAISDLLERKEAIQLSLPAPDGEGLKGLLRCIEERTGLKPAVEHPAADLEQFFLDVVARAHAQAGYATGASPQAHLPAFLQAGPSGETR
jgi:ABC-2 type transport system ATP-binding protein